MIVFTYPGRVPPLPQTPVCSSQGNRGGGGGECRGCAVSRGYGAFYVANAVQGWLVSRSVPKKVHWRVACRILHYLRGTADLGLTCSRAGNIGVELQCDLQMVVDIYASKVIGKRSVPGAAAMCGG